MNAMLDKLLTMFLILMAGYSCFVYLRFRRHVKEIREILSLLDAYRELMMKSVENLEGLTDSIRTLEDDEAFRKIESPIRTFLKSTVDSMATFDRIRSELKRLGG